MPDLPLNLLRDPWLPVRRRVEGRMVADVIRPAQVVERLDAAPVVAIDWPRADFRAATLEFLVGLLSTAVPPAQEHDWPGWWNEPPSVQALDRAFAPYAAAFEVDGAGPRFMQDMDPLEGEVLPIKSLLIEQPGGNTLKNNTDLLVKRAGDAVLSRAAAAMALFTLQAFAPSGGKGHRTGFRGGGPLSTLVTPPHASSLWQLLWTNVVPGPEAGHAALAAVFPWMAPTRDSREGSHRPLVRTGANRLQMFWATPRRIRLLFAANEAEAACAVTGDVDRVAATGFRTRPHGAQYDSSGWQHPLTPHYRPKANASLLPLHGQPGGTGYRDWIGLAVQDTNGLRRPAEVVQRYRDHRAVEIGAAGEPARLLVAGYDMDNAKARGFVEAEMPLPTLPDDEARIALDEHGRALVLAARAAVDALAGAVAAALFRANEKPKADSTVLTTAREVFWAATAEPFQRSVDAATTALAADPSASVEALQQEWLRVIRREALAGFDTAAPLEPDAYRPQGDGTQRIVEARRRLRGVLHGYCKAGNALFAALGLPLPEPAKTRRAGVKKRKAA